MPELDYYRAKALQENILAAGPIPYLIVRATQFMEFMDAVLSWTADSDTVRLPATPIQPIAAKDVADAVAEVAAGAPLNGVRNIAGPEILSWTSWAGSPWPARENTRTVVTDPTAGMFAVVKGDVLTDKDAASPPPATPTGSPPETSCTGDVSGDAAGPEPAASTADAEVATVRCGRSTRDRHTGRRSGHGPGAQVARAAGGRGGPARSHAGASAAVRMPQRWPAVRACRTGTTIWPARLTLNAGSSALTMPMSAMESSP